MDDLIGSFCLRGGVPLTLTLLLLPLLLLLLLLAVLLERKEERSGVAGAIGVEQLEEAGDRDSMSDSVLYSSLQ